MASKLEHCLLNAYIYTACTIKSTPEEFNVFSGENQHNRRSAIQFERAREWKKSILMVAHEEMLHLHYVQCLLRALGEKPYFQLPDKKPGTNNWFIPNWNIKNGKVLMDDEKGTIIPIEPCTYKNIQQFVLYESSDSLQDIGAVSEEAQKLYEKLFKFEIRLRIASMLLNITDEKIHEKLAENLYDIYTMLPVSEEQQPTEYSSKLLETVKVDDFQFQSIGDFYRNGIQGLYNTAFDKNWVTRDNLDLISEQGDINVAGEGFLPITPNNRYKSFPDSDEQEKYAHTNKKKPTHCKPKVPGWCRNKEDVDRIIKEIADEGEGFALFKVNAEQLLEDVTEIGGESEYLKAVIKNQDKKCHSATPDYLKNGQLVRESHLYRFAMIMMAFKQEQELADRRGIIQYKVHRTPVNIIENQQLEDFCEQLPSYFNACYLAMIMWLSRMYEIKDWQADKSQRQAIEMLAAWPIMSLGIRPFLELASFFELEQYKLFSFATDDLPSSSHALQLLKLYNSDERSEEINKEMDSYALNTLEDIATWADENYKIIQNSVIPEPEKQMILTRLTGLTVLKEFSPQFEFRTHGGYSDKSPNLSYQIHHCESDKYEEDPAKVDNNDEPIKIYENVLLLRLRFAGWGQVQLATDPDPPTDESGCSGTHMLHASDGKCVLNRALIWQKHKSDPTEITREPVKDLPTIGVNCVQLSLMASATDTELGYIPLSQMQSTGAVQTSGTQFDLSIEGMHEVWQCTPEKVTEASEKQIRIDLRDKNGKKPLLLGENHLVWKDGEPIDPFILSIRRDTSDTTEESTALEFEREIFNGNDISMIQMTPLERLRSRRGPTGFDSVANIPAWAKRNFLKDPRKQMVSKDYLEERAEKLCSAMKVKLDTPLHELTAEDVTEIVSFAERMRLVTFPPKNTVFAWLNATLHYGHTISGSLKIDQDNIICKAIEKQTGLACSIVAGKDRQEINSRWLIKYTLGVMDTDALSNFIFGELYVPLELGTSDKEVTFTKEWIYNVDLYQEIENYACQFDNPFWRCYPHRSKETRTLEIDGVTLIETFINSCHPAGYEYTQTGFQGVETCRQYVKLERDSEKMTKFTWKIIFGAKNSDALMNMVNFFGQQNDLIDVALKNYFTPVTTDS